MTLFFDLDGPLLDVSRRYVALHQQLLAQVGSQGMEGALYWQRKRARVPEEQVLAELGASAHAPFYLSRRLELIEAGDYLALDRTWPWVEGVLTELAAQHVLVIVTVRSDRAALSEELRRLGLARFFGAVLSVPAGEQVDRQKAALIGDYLRRRELSSHGNWVVGDTEADIGAGRLTGLFTAGVLCGIRDREHLAAAEPDVLLEDIRSLLEVLECHAGPPRAAPDF